MLSMFKTVWRTNKKTCIWLGVGGRKEGVFHLLSWRKTKRSSPESLYLQGGHFWHESMLPTSLEENQAPWNFTAEGTSKAMALLLSEKESLAREQNAPDIWGLWGSRSRLTCVNQHMEGFLARPVLAWALLSSPFLLASFPRRLDANHISYVPPSCFSGLHSLRHLWLDDNALTEIPVQAFRSLSALQAMTLALNKIHHIPDYAFGNLSSLVVL